MVKRGGTKRKIPIAKIVKKASLATCHTKRLHGLFSKASQLCLLSGGQMAILATPSSSNSNVAFYSFGHSSVDSVVGSYLAGKPPVPVPEVYSREDIGICLARKDLGLDLWWDHETLIKSENAGELRDALGSMSKLLTDFKDLHQVMKKNNHDEELKTQEPLDQICCVDHDEELNLERLDQFIVNYDDELKTQQPLDQICCVDHEEELKTQEPLDQICDNREEQNQMFSICDNVCVTDNNNNVDSGSLDRYYQDMDIEELIGLVDWV